MPGSDTTPQAMSAASPITADNRSAIGRRLLTSSTGGSGMASGSRMSWRCSSTMARSPLKSGLAIRAGLAAGGGKRPSGQRRYPVARPTRRISQCRVQIFSLMDRRTHDRLPLLSSSDVHKTTVSLLQSVGAGALRIEYVDSFATHRWRPIMPKLSPSSRSRGQIESAMVGSAVAGLAGHDRVGVQTFAERNKISLSRYRSRTGALSGTELLGNRRGRQNRGQYASYRKWPIRPPLASPHSYPRAADLRVTQHTHSRCRSATSDTHQLPRLKTWTRFIAIRVPARS